MRMLEKVVEVTARAFGYDWKREQAHGFVIGVCVSIGIGSLVMIVYKVSKSTATTTHSRSLLHHLDSRASLHNSSERSTLKELRARHVVLDGGSKIYQVVLTGGPCAGKSSSMEYMAERLRKLSFDVYLVPEVPTLLINGGCVYPGLDGGEALVSFEASLLELQLQMEQTFFNIAKSTGRPSVILYDRGLLDPAAYIPRALWNNVLNYNQWIRDGLLGVLERYDLILHLDTAARGAESYFRTSESRSQEEALSIARELDDKIRDSYMGHPHHHIVDNSTDFDRKLERVFAHLEAMVSKPKTLA